MALEKLINFKGFVVEKSYIRIDTIRGYKGDLQISVNSYVSKDSFQNGQGYLEQEFYNFMPDITDTASNFIKQGYEHLKTLEKYADAIDC